MPTLKLTGKSGPTRSTSTPKRKPAAKSTPKRKPAARTAPKPAAATAQATNGNGRGPKLPEGWSKSEFARAIKDMQKAKAAKEAASERLTEAQRAANAMAINLLNEGVQMSVISTELEMSRQWMYTLLDKLRDGLIDEDANPIEQTKPARKRTAAASKPAAKKRPAAKRTPARKPPAARKAPARKRPPAPAVTGRGRVRLAA